MLKRNSIAHFLSNPFHTFLEESLKHWKTYLPDVVNQINGFNKPQFRGSNEIMTSFFTDHQSIANIPQGNPFLYKYQQGNDPFYKKIKIK